MALSKSALNDALEQVARTQIGVETLETRKSDSLDFYDVSVWSIRSALQAAYELGRSQSAD